MLNMNRKLSIMNRNNRQIRRKEKEMRINVRFAGAGGQGVILASVLLAKGYGLGENYNIAQTQSYGP